LRAILSNVGSTGDLQPFFALAAELKRHGHQPVLAAAALFAPRAARLGIDFVQLGPQMESAVVQRLMARMLSTSDPALQLRYVLEATMPALPQSYRELLELSRGADVLIGGLTQPVVQMVHEATGIPWTSVQLVHTVVPNGDRPPPGVPLPSLPRPLGAPLNRGILRLFMAYMRRQTAPVVNRQRVALGFRPLRDPIFEAQHSAPLALYAVSRHVARPGPDWPPNLHLTGYFFLDEDEGWQPDAELQEFLSGGPPPVVVSFGSMIPADAARVTRAVLAAVAQVGCRAIIQQGWGGIGAGDLPPDVRVIGFAPHAWLFPRAALVVHHGGAGTTAATFRAGVPAVFVPHISDQPQWAAIARDLGVAGPAIPYPRLNADRLARALAATLTDSSYSRAAKELGALIRAEDGVGTARRLIEALVATPAAGPLAPR
jgi:UDP:flavonoid glycosyltransferase YjiC (YdhE family)